MGIEGRKRGRLRRGGFMRGALRATLRDGRTCGEAGAGASTLRTGPRGLLAGVALLALAMAGPAPAAENFSKFLQEGDDAGSAVASVSGGGLVACGQQDDDAWIVRLDDCGDVVWEKKYPVGTSSLLHRIIETTGGNFCSVGWAFFDTDEDLYAICVEPDGDIVWQKTYGGGASYDREDHGWDLVEGGDDELVLVGYMASFTSQRTDRDFWLILVDRDDGTIKTAMIGGVPNVSQQIRIGAEGQEEARAVFVDDAVLWKIVVAGWPDSATLSAGGKDMYVLRATTLVVKPPGWQICYGGDGDEAAYAGLKLSDGGVVLVGEESTTAGGDYGPNIWALKIQESDGDILWQQSYRSETENVGEFGFNIMEHSTTGDLFIGGQGEADRAAHNGRTSNDMLLLKVDPDDGTLAWAKYYDSRPGDGYGDNGASVAEAADGDILFSGETFAPWPTLEYDWWVLKLNSSGNVVDPPSDEGECWFNSAGLDAYETDEEYNGISITGIATSAGVASHDSVEETSLSAETPCESAQCS